MTDTTTAKYDAEKPRKLADEVIVDCIKDFICRFPLAHLPRFQDSPQFGEFCLRVYSMGWNDHRAISVKHTPESANTPTPKYAPFDLEKAKAGAPILCLFPGVFPRTARLLAHDLKGDFPLVVAIQDKKTKDNEYVLFFTDAGVDEFGTLVMAPVKHTGWIVIAPPISDSDYVAYSSNVYCTEQKALDHCDPRTEVVIQIKWEA